LGLVQPLGTNVGQLLGGDVVEERIRHGVSNRARKLRRRLPRWHYGKRTTFPHWPDLIRSKPLAKSLIGNVCVTIGLMLRPALNSPASRYQVLNNRRPVMPCTRMPLKMMSLARSQVTGPVGIPKSVTRPPFFTALKAR